MEGGGGWRVGVAGGWGWEHLGVGTDTVTRSVGFKYTFWNQIQIQRQLDQTKFKYIGFPDLNSNINSTINF